MPPVSEARLEGRTAIVTGAAQGIERTVLEIDDVLRGRIVEHQTDQERAPERQSTRLRIRGIAALLHQGHDAVAGFRPHQRRVVDDARHGLLGNAGEPRDVVDRGLAARQRGRIHPRRRCGGIGACGARWPGLVHRRSVPARRRCIAGDAVAATALIAAPRATTATVPAPG